MANNEYDTILMYYNLKIFFVNYWWWKSPEMSVRLLSKEWVFLCFFLGLCQCIALRMHPSVKGETDKV